jgi:hypothetical protein
MILFAGDSFSAWDDDESWTHHFDKDIGLGFRNCSIEGSSLWTAFSQLDIEDYKIQNNYYDYLILTCTNYRRIPFCHNPHLNSFRGEVEKDLTNIDEIKNNIAHVNYYDKFYNEKMHRFLYDRVLEFIITKFSNHTKLILLPIIEDSLDTIKKASVIWPNDFSYLNFPLWDISIKRKDVKNHFTKEMNYSFGKLLAEKVKQNNFGPLNLTVREIKEALK